MLTETGLVVALEADALWVQTIRRSTCGSCAAQTGCGHGLLNKVSDGKRGYIRALPGEQGIGNFHIGQQVLLGIPEEIILRGSFIAYLLPLLCMLAGSTAAVKWLPGSADLVAVLGASTGLALGFGLVRWHCARHRRDPDFQPVLLRAVGPQPEPVTLP
jgi:sigma-E factor negative regulatory protein RseC